MKILILSHEEVTTLLPMQTCIEVMREALTALAQGHVYQPLRTVVRPPGAAGVLGTMPAYASGERAAFGLKALCVFPQNPSRGLDSHQGAVMLFSAETGVLLAMMNAAAITAIRTAAVSGVATDLLARPAAGDLAIIGSGVQARSHLQAMATVRPIRRCRIASRRRQKAETFVKDMQKQFAFEIEVVGTVAEALDGADLIVTATNVAQPIVRREWISPGAHLNAVGSSIPSTREIDGPTMAASRLFVDRRESTINEAGDYLFAVREGAIDADHIQAEIGEVLVGQNLGRTSPEEITLFKSLGLATEDLFAAEYLFRRASDLRVGTWVEY